MTDVTELQVTKSSPAVSGKGNQGASTSRPYKTTPYGPSLAWTDSSRKSGVRPSSSSETSCLRVIQ